MFTPPKPPSRPDDAGLWQRLRLFRGDIFQSQPVRLYRAWMAETKGPFYRSYLINDPDLVAQVLKGARDDFPKDGAVRDALNPLLGQSVFVTNGETWAAQRRIIDPAFEGGRLQHSFAPMKAAIEDMIARLEPGEIEAEYECSYVAADIIFRTLFSRPISDATAMAVFTEFRRFQRAQPMLSLAALIRAPAWVPRWRRRDIRRSAATIRGLLSQMIAARRTEIAQGSAPDDLATHIMTRTDPETGMGFTEAQMLDQVAIFFLAGHETSASGLAWALYCLANAPDWQAKVATEAPAHPQFRDMSKLRITRDVFREVLRLYPPVPMMLRRAARPQNWRKRMVKAGSLIILSPWHLHRHERLWPAPDAFDPARWSDPAQQDLTRRAYMPFSAGPRVCSGAGFAMLEGVLALSMLVRAYEFRAVGTPPRPVAHLTVRAQDGIRLCVHRRDIAAAQTPE